MKSPSLPPGSAVCRRCRPSWKSWVTAMWDARPVRRHQRPGSLSDPGLAFQHRLRRLHDPSPQPSPVRPRPRRGGDDAGSFHRTACGSAFLLPGGPAAPFRQHEPVGQSSHGEGISLAPFRPLALDLALDRPMCDPVAGPQLHRRFRRAGLGSGGYRRRSGLAANRPLILFAPSLAAGLVSTERETGTWQLSAHDALDCRLDPARQIAERRLAAVAVIVRHPARLRGDGDGSPIDAQQVQRVVICLALTAVFAVLVSAAASSLFRADRRGMTASYLALLAFCMGPLLVWLGREAPFGHTTVQAALSIDPVAAALQAPIRRVRPVRAIAPQLVDHRLHLRCPAVLPGYADMAALSTGISLAASRRRAQASSPTARG